jgi:hypothetical protein
LPDFVNAGQPASNLFVVYLEMHIRFAIILALLLSRLSYSQEGYLPYGTMRVNQSMIADQTEILVEEWLGFVISSCDSNSTRFLHAKRKLSDEDKNFLRKFRYPDSLLPTRNIMSSLDWFGVLDTTKGYRIYKTHGSNSHQTLPVSNSFFDSKARRKELDHLLNLPITGISYEQAVAFCRWRTFIDSLRSDTMCFLHYTFSLPTIAEFNLMNQQFDSTITKSRHFSIMRGYEPSRVGFNYRNVPDSFLNKESRSNDLQEVWEYDPDGLGLYAIQGNVAEMTSRKGAACGGSYFHYAIESYHYKIQVYEHAERWLGFRCVATIQ